MAVDIFERGSDSMSATMRLTLKMQLTPAFISIWIGENEGKGKRGGGYFKKVCLFDNNGILHHSLGKKLIFSLQCQINAPGEQDWVFIWSSSTVTVTKHSKS